MLVLRISIWIALVAWLAGPAAALVGRRHAGWQRLARRLWTLGCAAFLVHVAAAFHFVHGWSHAAAHAATARDTAAVTGFDSGAGLWLNYLFTALWLGDAVAWWRLGTGGYRRRSAAWTIAVYGFMAFLAFNATVVFEQGWVRVGGVLGSLLLATLVVLRLRHRRRPAEPFGEPAGASVRTERDGKITLIR